MMLASKGIFNWGEMFEDVRVAVPTFYAHITDVQNSRIVKVPNEQPL